MADYRQYQPRRGAGTGTWRVIVLAVGSLVVLTILGVWAFGRGGNKTADDGTPSIRLVNDSNTNSSAASNANENTNSATNTNTNSSTETSPAAELTTAESTAILNQCGTALSGLSTGSGVALTFDIAADNEDAGKLIDVLKAKGVPASFFVTGSYSTDHSDLLKRLIAAGFPVYSRGSSTSKHFDTMSAEQVTADLVAAETAISAASGQTTKPFFRPSRGETSSAQVKAAQQAGFCTILWSVDGNDWDDSQTVDGAVSRILDKAKDGSIILLHAGYTITPDVVTQLLTQLGSKSLTPVSLSSLFVAGD